ncbi:hypothetical protein BATDEDRAFT_88669 [Batrachochytrium dendrobatidis JAM81]|uniref:SAP domain-containing protein n=1 Tax=Batrachochytrium dendrobatidis (strain JAM81 / FGSC 10211) TaxID=684364 RepID=F4P2Z1_BATDJ|nr:uncharacterized protein BATDEDRAFT_88669 [Batrachochytrium dendrobatidis JAM81]EGF80522.1 hypothetical protein BATDEDRAFT_88669 [Batrachochytrium dendrobatidis JAM81]|eukprot:XP_006679308.1 hypothetical protein BATDEDRAFT_88669 [Batrachochytrium dendrobatidis JAM81]
MVWSRVVLAPSPSASFLFARTHLFRTLLKPTALLIFIRSPDRWLSNFIGFAPTSNLLIPSTSSSATNGLSSPKNISQGTLTKTPAPFGNKSMKPLFQKVQLKSFPALRLKKPTDDSLKTAVKDLSTIKISTESLKKSKIQPKSSASKNLTSDLIGESCAISNKQAIACDEANSTTAHKFIDPSKYSNIELMKMCKEMGLKQNGRKKDIVTRLNDFISLQTTPLSNASNQNQLATQHIVSALTNLQSNCVDLSRYTNDQLKKLFCHIYFGHAQTRNSIVGLIHKSRMHAVSTLKRAESNARATRTFTESMPVCDTNINLHRYSKIQLEQIFNHIDFSCAKLKTDVLAKISGSEMTFDAKKQVSKSVDLALNPTNDFIHTELSVADLSKKTKHQNTFNNSNIRLLKKIRFQSIDEPLCNFVENAKNKTIPSNIDQNSKGLAINQTKKSASKRGFKNAPIDTTIIHKPETIKDAPTEKKPSDIYDLDRKQIDKPKKFDLSSTGSKERLIDRTKDLDSENNSFSQDSTLHSLKNTQPITNNNLEPAVDLSSKSLLELQKMCKERGLFYSTTKAKLVERIVAYDSESEDKKAIMRSRNLGIRNSISPKSIEANTAAKAFISKISFNSPPIDFEALKSIGIDNLKISNLAPLCRHFGLPGTGLKSEMIKRLNALQKGDIKILPYKSVLAIDIGTANLGFAHVKLEPKENSSLLATSKLSDDASKRKRASNHQMIPTIKDWGHLDPNLSTRYHPQLYANTLQQLLDQRLFKNDVQTVLVERQTLRPIGPRMSIPHAILQTNAFEGILIGMMTERGRAQNLSIHSISPSAVSDHFELPAVRDHLMKTSAKASCNKATPLADDSETENTTMLKAPFKKSNIQNMYKYKKLASINVVKYLLDRGFVICSSDLRYMFDHSPKKDDLSDSLLMALAHIDWCMAAEKFVSFK